MIPIAPLSSAWGSSASAFRNGALALHAADAGRRLRHDAGHVTSSNTILQTLVDEKMRGRVMSYYTMAFVGMAPFGSLLAGALAHAHRRAAHRHGQRQSPAFWARCGSGRS
jgi:MFS family permease